MKLTLAQVQHVARLARLALTPAEAEQYRGQLSAILDAVEALAQVDTAGVPPTSACPLPDGEAPGAGERPDVVTASLTPEEALADAPAREGQSFLIPRVLE